MPPTTALATPAPPSERCSRRFVRWLLVASVVLLGCVGALNAYVDPLGVTSRHTRWRVVVNEQVRSEKLDLYEARTRAPDVLVLGSSRSMRVDPRDIRRAGAGSAFNLAVSGGTPQDAYLLTQWIAKRAAVAGPFPHLVYGLDLDSFRAKQAASSLAGDPRIEGLQGRGGAGSPGVRQRALDRLDTSAQLLELSTLRLSARALRDELRGATARPGSALRADGFESRARTRHHHDAAWVAARVEQQMPGYMSVVFGRDSFRGIEAGPLEYFVRTIELANSRGDAPTVWLTPYQPRAERLMAERHDVDERTSELLRAMRELERRPDLDFRFADLSRLGSFGGDPLEFTDGIHMTPANTRRVVRELARRQLLARPAPV